MIVLISLLLILGAAVSSPCRLTWSSSTSWLVYKSVISYIAISAKFLKYSSAGKIWKFGLYGTILNVVHLFHLRATKFMRTLLPSSLLSNTNGFEATLRQLCYLFSYPFLHKITDLSTKNQRPPFNKWSLSIIPIHANWWRLKLMNTAGKWDCRFPFQGF